MIARLPETVQHAWGDAVARDFSGWMEDVMAERAVNRDEWGEVQFRLDGVETRLGQVETRLTIVEHGLSELKVDVRELRRETTERFDRLQAMFDDRFDRLSLEMAGRFDHLNRQLLYQTRLSLGLLGVFGTVIAILVGIGQLAR